MTFLLYLLNLLTYLLNLPLGIVIQNLKHTLLLFALCLGLFGLQFGAVHRATAVCCNQQHQLPALLNLE